ncbi:MAG: hypothetical protein IJH04_08785, partial [Eggerthellaceae bacterium]|nr:hypothetical protein [Eggerthellaceae bacterium]
MSYDDSGARHAVRDYYEGCTFIDADFPVEGREIGPCRKCQRPIWIDAPFCGHCYYDPAVEQAKYAAQLERARAKQMEIYKLTAGGFVIGFLFLGLPSGGFFE